MIKEITPINVVYVSYFGNPANNDAFLKLEKIVPLQGNKFYGVFYPGTSEYRACAQITDPKLFAKYGLPTMTIEGGKYAYEKIEGPYEEIVVQIPSVFQRLKQSNIVDETRPSIEFYKRHTEFILMLPVL